MENKQKCYSYILISLVVLTLFVGKIHASEYINYYGISMTSQQYNNLSNLGFSENEIYYMDEETFNINKDSEATLLATNSKYFKTIYTGLDGAEYTTEITENEYDNQSSIDPRGTVSTSYKEMVTVIAQNGNYYRYKVTVNWKQLPSTRSYDIIGIGFDDPVYITSPVYFNYSYCVSSGDCNTSTLYYDRKKVSTGGSVVYKLPGSEAISLGAVLYYDVAKNTTDTITRIEMYGDYAHATSNISGTSYTNHNITMDGIILGTNIYSKYDAIPCAVSAWNITW